MKRNVLIVALTALVALGIAIGVHLVNDKVWQCEHFLSKYQAELEEIAKYAMKTDDNLSLQEDNYKEVSFPASIEEAMKTYFINVYYGSINVLNDASKWRWDLQGRIPETELVSFEITYKPDMTYDNAGKKEYRYSKYYLLCYTELNQDQLMKRLGAPSEKYEVLPTNEPRWLIVIEDQQ